MKRIATTIVAIATVHLALSGSLLWYLVANFDEDGLRPDPPGYQTAYFVHRVVAQPSNVLWRVLHLHHLPTAIVLLGDALLWGVILGFLVNVAYLIRKRSRQP